jgi:PAS domain S-box-containing protein
MWGMPVNPDKSRKGIDQAVQAGEELAANRQRLDAHLDNSPLAVVELDPQLRITRWSAGATRIFGWDAEEVVGRELFALRWVHEEDIDAVRRVMADMFDDRRPRSRAVLRNYRKDGSVRDCEWYNSAIYDARHRLTSIFCQVLDVTDRKRAEDELAERNKRYELIAAGSYDAIWDWDVPNHRVYFSPRWKELRGLTPEEVSDREEEWSSGIHPEDAPRVMAAVKAHFAGETPIFEQEYRIRCKDGSWRWIHDRGIAERNAAGQVVRMAGSESDITERKRTEEALRRQVALTRHYIDTVQTVIVALDSEGRITLINREGCRILGYDEEELLGRNWFETCVPQPDGLNTVYVTFRKIMDGELEAAEYYENPVRCRDGSRRLIAWHNAPLTDPDGRVIGTLSSGEDITERKRGEEALRASEARFRQLADAMPQLVWTAGPDGAVDYFNSRAGEYAGLTQSPDDGWRWIRVLHPDDVERCLQIWQEALSRGMTYDCEHRLRMTDGSWRWHLSRAVPVRDEQWHVVKWFGTATDIQDLKLAQEALREADRRKDAFLATLAHELRNPLAPIRNAVQILKRNDATEPARQAAREMIDRQLRHMVHLIDDLLDVSRITRGKLQLQRQRVDLTEVLEHAVDVIRPLIEGADLDLSVTLPPHPVHVDADPVRLTQVLTNLLDNAGKYTGKGGAIRLCAERDAAEVVLTLSDTGIGIAREDLPHVFDMFTQVQSESERATSGLGIGLALTRGLVEMHGGEIEALSDGPGTGSTFIIRLPADPGTPASSPSRPETASEPVTAKHRVLVADDTEDVARSLAVLLNLEGHEVAIAHDGLEAVQAAERMRPDLVLLDLGMPKLDGYGACRRIREQPWGKALHIVAFTGWGQDEARRKCDEAGFDGHLVKPVDPDNVLRLLAELEPARPGDHQGG